MRFGSCLFTSRHILKKDWSAIFQILWAVSPEETSFSVVVIIVLVYVHGNVFVVVVVVFVVVVLVNS